MMHYRVVLKRASNGTVVATFPDVPEAHTAGNDEAQAVARAPDALETALASYVDERRDLPRPALPVKDQSVALDLVAVQALEEAHAEQGDEQGGFVDPGLHVAQDELADAQPP